jgi:hypothetical protein
MVTAKMVTAMTNRMIRRVTRKKRTKRSQTKILVTPTKILTKPSAPYLMAI